MGGQRQDREFQSSLQRRIWKIIEVQNRRIYYIVLFTFYFRIVDVGGRFRNNDIF